jgi:UDPglucose 6-dehydrogenase
MGRRVTTTDDHPFITRDGRKLADELTTDDWLPLAQGTATREWIRPERLNVVGSFEPAGLEPADVIVRPQPEELAVLGAREVQSGIAELGNRRGEAVRSYDILRTGTLRLHEAAVLDVELEDASVGTAKNGMYVPASIEADEDFWRIVGLYIAEGHVSRERDSGRIRLFWSFHPTDEGALVDEVADYWQTRGVKVTVRRTNTTMTVGVSSRLLGTWWTEVLGLGANCYEQRLPDSIWGESEAHKRALLAGMWLGDGSWSYVNQGPSVVLEYGTVSRELADGALRLLADLGVVARLKVGRAAKSTVDTYWLVISGAQQILRVLELVPPDSQEAIVRSLRTTKRIAPTGYRRDSNAAWVRVTSVERRPFDGYVYSLEVPPNHTFVTTGGLVCSNCFPKDVTALKQLAGNSGYQFMLLQAVWEVNELQKRRVVQKLQKHLGSLRGKTIALLGLAFKPNTDDMREAPSRIIAYRLLSEGAEVRGWDPVAQPDNLPGIELCDSVLDAVRGADAAVIVTEWPELSSLATPEVRDAMAFPLIIDGRNLLDPEVPRANGFAYEGIGRPRHVSIAERRRELQT